MGLPWGNYVLSPESSGDSLEFYTYVQFSEEEQRSWQKRRKTNVLEPKGRVFQMGLRFQQWQALLGCVCRTLPPWDSLYLESCKWVAASKRILSGEPRQESQVARPGKGIEQRKAWEGGTKNPIFEEEKADGDLG